MEYMTYKDDPWLTDYLTAIHFSVRLIESKTRNIHALYRLKTETDALIQEAILGSLPLELMVIQRLAARIRKAEARLNLISQHIGEPEAGKTDPEGSRADLRSDYRFILDGFEAFTLKGIIRECGRYFPKIYPEVEDPAAVVSELFRRDIDSGAIEEIRIGIYGHSGTR
jgi:hypothetical protein